MEQRKKNPVLHGRSIPSVHAVPDFFTYLHPTFFSF